MNDLTFLSCVRFSLELMAAAVVLVFFLPRRKHFGIRLAGGLAGYFLLAYGIFMGTRAIFGDMLIGETLYYLLLVADMLAMVGFCFEVTEKELLFVGTGAYAIEHLAFNLIQLSFYIPGAGAWLSRQPVWNYALLYILLPIVIYFRLIRPSRENGELVDKDSRMIILAAGTMFVTIFISLVARMTPGTDTQELESWLYGSVCCVLSLFLLVYIPKENHLRHEQQILEQMIRVMGEQQELSKESVEIINRKCHDIKHQLKALMEIENSEERRKYTEEIREAVSIYDAIYQTGNGALDFVLREKALLCQEYEIKLSALTDGKELNFLETMDIYALFGNILENAIESVIREPDTEKRIINLHVLRRAQLLHIHADNYCGGELSFEDGLPVTIKDDKAYHGFGTKSIRHVVEKYGGELQMKKEKDRFILDILLPVPETRKE